MSPRGPLHGYRALDLTDHRGALAGRLLADLGVDVVKLEPPGGEPDRLVPPYAADRPGPTRWTRGLPAEEAAARLQAHGIAGGVVATCADLHADPQLRHTGFFVAVDHPVIGAAPVEGHAFRLPACPPAWRAAPLWGQHTEEVFGELLGLPRAEVARLRAAEILW